ncbi:MAG: hypothetical protein WC755_09215, partial [Candidatus Woesearchaeota archaeon]
DEILEEIRRGRIKNSSTLADIIYENDLTTKRIDDEEYGHFNNLDFLIPTLNDNFYDMRKLFRPFLDEYLANFNNKNYKLITYGSVNIFGVCILSKLKNDKNIDFDIHLKFALEHYGHIDDISTQPIVYAFLRFKKSPDKVHASIFTPEFLEKSYGYNQNFRLQQKLPVLFRDYDFMITSEEGEILSIANDGELIEQAGPLRDNVQRRRNLTKEYDIPSFN